jgi:hypothetical protein
LRDGNGHGMREESHLDAMRDAIRGDFERLEERRGEQVVLRIRERPESEERAAAEPAASDGEDVRPRRSWIDRLLGL